MKTVMQSVGFALLSISLSMVCWSLLVSPAFASATDCTAKCNMSMGSECTTQGAACKDKPEGDRNCGCRDDNCGGGDCCGCGG